MYTQRSTRKVSSRMDGGEKAGNYFAWREGAILLSISRGTALALSLFANLIIKMNRVHVYVRLLIYARVSECF